MRTTVTIQEDLPRSSSNASRRRRRSTRSGRYTCNRPRGILAIMGFFAFYVFATLRLNISIAIVAMVNWTAIAQDGYIDRQPECVYDQQNITKTLKNGEFKWNAEMQGYILSSYFLGLSATQLLGGRLSEKYSAKMVLFYGTLLATLTNFLAPLAARIHVYFLIALQILKGTGQGILVPAFSAMVGNWVIVRNRTTFMSIVSCGMPIGAFVTVLISGFLCEVNFMGGWPSVFYVCAIISGLWCVFWFVLIYDSPLQHPWVPEKDIHRFMSIRTQTTMHVKPKIPIKAMVTSLVVWAYIFVGFASFWTISLYNIILPTFLGTILRYPIEMNGLYSSLPNLVQAFFMVTSSFLCEFAATKRYAKITTIRKIAIVSGLGGFSVCMIALTFAGCNRPLIVFLLIMALGVSGISFPAVMILPVDITPKFAGSLAGFQSTFGSLSGLMIPIIVGFLTEKDPTIREWHIVFYISGGICLFAITFFLIFGKSEVQTWNYPEPTSSETDLER